MRVPCNPTLEAAAEDFMTLGPLNSKGELLLDAKSNQNFMDLVPHPLPVQTSSRRHLAQDVMNFTEKI